MKATTQLIVKRPARREVRDRIVLEHLPLVRAIAIRVHESLPVHVELDDLVNAGVMGLFDAAAKYNPQRNVAFKSYAKHRIKGAILDSLRQLDWASRDARKRLKQIETATRELSAEHGRAPTEAELAQRMGMSLERWRHVARDLRAGGTVSAPEAVFDSEQAPGPEFPDRNQRQPDELCVHEQLRRTLAAAMKTLPQRYQRVVLLYYNNELTMKEIGGMMGINESRVSQIHKAALEKMNRALRLAGICSFEALA